MADKADIGVTGLAVMGSNLARNFAKHGYTVAVHNRHDDKTKALVADHGDDGTFLPAEDAESFVASLDRPRKLMIMVAAGKGTDAVIEQFVPLLEKGDILIDGGNAHYTDTLRRTDDLAKLGLNFVGTGVSGGEEGALNGPSIMPGGSDEAYETLGPMLEKIAAHVDGVPCCTHIGPNAAGHFVKMVHNGIEYADMQLIGETYDLMRRGLGMAPKEIAEVFRGWNDGRLSSFLIEITAQLLAHDDPSTGKPFVDVIVDQAGAKGTGGWTVQAALDLGIPVPGIAEAVSARALSSHRDLRDVGPSLAGPSGAPTLNRDELLTDLEQALYASKIVSYAQGFHEIAGGSENYDWGINLGDMAKIWRGGCIIRAAFLDRITSAFDQNAALPTLLADKGFADDLGGAQDGWRRVVAAGAASGVPTPGIASALGYYDGLRAERLPAALIQAQRDLFGAHTYHRVDKDGTFHTDWGHGEPTESEV